MRVARRLPLELRQVADEREPLETGDLVIRLGFGAARCKILS